MFKLEYPKSGEYYLLDWQWLLLVRKNRAFVCSAQIWKLISLTDIADFFNKTTEIMCRLTPGDSTLCASYHDINHTVTVNDSDQRWFHGYHSLKHTVINVPSRTIMCGAYFIIYLKHDILINHINKFNCFSDDQLFPLLFSLPDMPNSSNSCAVPRLVMQYRHFKASNNMTNSRPKVTFT